MFAVLAFESEKIQTNSSGETTVCKTNVLFFVKTRNLKCDKKLVDLELMIFHPATVKLNVETLMLNVFKVISGQII